MKNRKKVIQFPEIAPKNNVVQFPVKKQFHVLPTWKDLPQFKTIGVDDDCTSFECFGLSGGDTVIYRVTNNIEETENHLIAYCVGKSKTPSLGIITKTANGLLKISVKGYEPSYFKKTEIRLIGIIEAKIKTQ